jgi:hypothetical protein
VLRKKLLLAGWDPESAGLPSADAVPTLDMTKTSKKPTKKVVPVDKQAIKEAKYSFILEFNVSFPGGSELISSCNQCRSLSKKPESAGDKPKTPRKRKRPSNTHKNYVLLVA